MQCLGIFTSASAWMQMAESGMLGQQCSRTLVKKMIKVIKKEHEIRMKQMKAKKQSDNTGV